LRLTVLLCEHIASDPSIACHCYESYWFSYVILREERPKDLKLLHYVRSFAIAQDDGNALVYSGVVNTC